MSLTPAEVELALRNNSEWFHWDELEYNVPEALEIDGVTYPVELLNSQTGEEGDYEIGTYIVIKVGDQTFRKTGYYQSHVGNDWDGPFREVVPVEKYITVWEDK